MPLKAKYDSQDQIPEAQRPLYVERDGAWYLDAEGVEDVSGLKNALERLKQEKKDLAKQAEKYKEIDPDKYRALLQAAEEAEQEKLKNQGKFEELFQQRVKTLTAEHEKERQKLTGDLTSVQKMLAEERVTNALTKAAVAEGVREDAIAHAVRIWSQDTWKLGPDGKAAAFDGDTPLYGSKGEALSMGEFIKKELHDKPYLAKPSSGTGAQHQGGTSGAKVITLTRAQAKDSRTYEAAKQQAAQSGAQLQIEG
jgi:hypothetical protein